MRELLFVLLALAALAILEGGYYVLRYLLERRTEQLRSRLRAVSLGQAVAGGLLRSRRFAGSELVHSFLSAVPLTRMLERLLEQADSRMTVAQLIAYSLIAGTGSCMGALLFKLGLPVALLLTAVALSLPVLSLLLARDQRSQKMSEQLPDALEMMARALRAGNAVSNTLQLVAAELPEPINLEFGRAFEEQRLGVPIERAIVHMTERVPTNRDLRIFAVSLIVQKETGGNLAEILDGIAKTIRERYRFFGKVRALTAEGRVSGMILGFLPIGMAIFLALFNAPYLRGALEDPLGHTILAYAVGSWLVGAFWLHRMTKVDY